MRQIFKYSLFITFSVLCSALAAQHTFSKRFAEGHQNMWINAVASTDSAYYAAGVYIDGSFNSFIYCFDLQGNIIRRKNLRTPDSLSIDQTTRDFLPTNRGSFILGGRVFTNKTEGVLMEYFPAEDSIKTHLFYFDLPEYADGFGGFARIKATTDNQILIVATMETATPGPDSDIALFQFDLDFNGIDTLLFVHPWDQTGGIAIKNDENIIMANLTFGQWEHNYPRQIRVRDFASDGNLVNEYITPLDEQWSEPRDIIQTTDGGYLIGSAEGYFLNFPQGPTDSISIFVYRPHLMKLNAALEREWIMPLGYDWPSGGAYRNINDITPTNDGHYVVIGEAEKIPVGPDTSRTLGLIAKVSETGEKFWERELYWMDTIMHRHFLFDITNTTDGGYILGGQANGFVNGDITVAGQQAWLLKLDEYGCLVPGCQGPVSTDAAVPPDLIWEPLLYPNPASNLLSVYFPPWESYDDNIEVEIVDSNGRRLHYAKHLRPEATYLLDVSTWASGVYYLKCAVDGKVILPKQFLVQK